MLDAILALFGWDGSPFRRRLLFLALWAAFVAILIGIAALIRA
ncbi:MAG TPA: hypothetical protein VH306_09610 [Gaiellaceae bacterium]|jgi:hypothetical protein